MVRLGVGYCLGIVLVFQVKFAVNSFGHLWGRQRFATGTSLEDSVARSEQVKDDPEARVAKRDIRAEWFEIKTLYDDDPTDEIKAIVERAKKLLEATPKPTG